MGLFGGTPTRTRETRVLQQPALVYQSFIIFFTSFFTRPPVNFCKWLIEHLKLYHFFTTFILLCR